ncbi:hypothetical protein AQPE_1359 [Aquipluma nitroreducens]|uniref:Lipoprotein n=1 Tax=Aquipluma nitroreducens TaxID=2010828 RepID=A0A5K7S6S6_9BACT|nr:hypothetical protein [Aquipluma nitroreducens]BBE17210.1 hypothetical protein AQPE_1359 [Aquipluma nitroreducens]
MKKEISFIFLALLSVLAACSKEDFNYQSEFEKSFQKWENFKSDSGNSYTYVVYNSSWVGASWQTQITVSNGVVTERSFKMISAQGLDEIPLADREWTENGSELNSHTTGAALLTLDQIYEKARIDWLVKRKNTITYFEAQNNGLLSSCGYVEDGCQDDCFVGVRISSIKAIAFCYTR